MKTNKQLAKDRQAKRDRERLLKLKKHIKPINMILGQVGNPRNK